MLPSSSLQTWSRRAAKGRFAVIVALVAPKLVRELRTRGLKATLEKLDAEPTTSTRFIRRLAGGLDPEEARQAVAWAFSVAPHLRGACLEQSLVQYALQNDARFVIGVKREDAAMPLDAHAWVEADERPREGRAFAAILTRGLEERP